MGFGQAAACDSSTYQKTGASTSCVCPAPKGGSAASAVMMRVVVQQTIDSPYVFVGVGGEDMEAEPSTSQGVGVGIDIPHPECSIANQAPISNGSVTRNTAIGNLKGNGANANAAPLAPIQVDSLPIQSTPASAVGGGVCIELDPSVSLQVTVSKLRAELQLTTYPVSGEEEVEGLSASVMRELGALIEKVGLWGLPYLEPGRVQCQDLRNLVGVLRVFICAARH